MPPARLRVDELMPIFYSCSASIGPGAIKNAVFQAFLKYVVPQNEGKADPGLDSLAVFLR
jgi:hypothetical protein